MMVIRYGTPMPAASASYHLCSAPRIFVACPMSAFANEELYIAFRSKVIGFCEELSHLIHPKWIFFAGSNITRFGDFDPNSDALKVDADKIWESDYFILLYPDKILSSAIVEVGIALGLRKPIAIVCKKRSDLPYVLRSADTSKSVNIREPRILTSDFSASNLNSIADQVARTFLVVAE